MISLGCRFQLHRLTLASLIVLFLLGAMNAALASDSVYLMSYFHDSPSGDGTNGSSGLHLAYSLDGLSYHALNGDAGLMKDTVNSSFMRDPCVYQSSDGVYRMVYTTSWGTTSFGYSESTDLIHWSTSTAVNIMSSVTGVTHTWAPQIIYDNSTSKYVVYWSSNISIGKNSIWFATTTDFRSYSSPAVLYGDSNLDVIDADIVWNGTNYVMIAKDEPLGNKYLFSAVGGTSVLSAYTLTGTTAVTDRTSYEAEGPTTVKVGDAWYCINDHYMMPSSSQKGIRMGAMVSYDNLQTWQEATGAVAIPKYARHAKVQMTDYSTVANVITATGTLTTEIEFTGTAANADFSAASNWFGGVTPTGSQTPVIQLGHTVVMSKSPSGTFTNLYVGQTGSGSLTINGTASVAVSSNIFVGSCSLGQGEVTQAGSSSVTANSYVCIGKIGSGSYRMQGGSFTINNDFNVADMLGSKGNLILEGGIVTSKQFYVGSGYNDTWTDYERTANGTWTTGNAVGVVMQSGGTMAVSGSADVIIGGRNTATGSGCGVGTYNISGGVFNPGSCGVFVGGYGTGTVNQSGGTFNAKQALVIGRYSTSTGTYAIGGGTLSQSSTSYRLTVGGSGAGTLTVSGSGLVDAAGGVRLSNSSTATGTLNLDGGTLQTASITDGGGTSKLNFNGGTLKAKSSTTSFLSGLDGAYVLEGGAKFDTNGYNVTVGQSLLSGVGSGSDGGLTKSGSGTLTLTGNLAYTGATQINAGQITVAGTCTLSSVVGASGTLALGTNAVVTVGTLVADTLIIGATVSAATSSAEAVPEPATCGLLFAAFGAACFFLRRRFR